MIVHRMFQANSVLKYKGVHEVKRDLGLGSLTPRAGLS